jgi:hypothetical protein
MSRWKILMLLERRDAAAHAQAIVRDSALSGLSM